MVRRLHGIEVRYGVGRRWHGRVGGQPWSFGRDEEGWFGTRRTRGPQRSEPKLCGAPTLSRAVEAALCLELCGDADGFTVWEVRR